MSGFEGIGQKRSVDNPDDNPDDNPNKKSNVFDFLPSSDEDEDESDYEETVEAILGDAVNYINYNKKDKNGKYTSLRYPNVHRMRNATKKQFSKMVLNKNATTEHYLQKEEEQIAKDNAYKFKKIKKPETIQEYYDNNKYLNNNNNEAIKKIKGDLLDREYRHRGRQIRRTPEELRAITDLANSQAEEIYKILKDKNNITEEEKQELDTNEVMMRLEKASEQYNQMGYESPEYDSEQEEEHRKMMEEYEEEEKAEKERKIKEEKDYQKYLEECAEKEACDKKEMEIKKLHLNEAGLKNDEMETKIRKKKLDRVRAHANKKRVADVTKDEMTKEETQKVIPTLELGDDIQSNATFQDDDVIYTYSVIKKSDTTELNHDWKVIWNIYQDYSRIKYYNPTFKLEIFEKPIKGIPKYDNEHIRNNLKKVYNEVNDKSKIIVWNPVRHDGMVDIYDPTINLHEPITGMRMDWDDTTGNDRPYYVYNIGYKSTPTYEPPMDKLSSASFRGIHGVYTNEKVAEPKNPEQGNRKQPGGKRKTQKQKKKTKKAGKKTTQKKRKQIKQKRGTRGKK